MGAKWFWGIVILAIASLLWSLMTAPKRSANMGADIQSALRSAGYTETQVDMKGNVAKLTGNVASESTASDIVSIAENTKCSACANKKNWHIVKNDLTVKTAPAIAAQSPYTFGAVKSENGNVVLDGYVQSDEQRSRVLAKAGAEFGADNVTDRTIKIASGAPNANWEGVISTYIDELKTLDVGKFGMTDTTSFITGQAASIAIRDRVNAATAALPAGYKGKASISSPKAAASCQSVLNDIKRGKKINFAYNKAEIRGAQSFDLLNALAAAANKECAAFNINIEGHTDSDGSADYNQRLSEARANTVVAYLSENNVAVNRITAIGAGETKPIGDNATSDGKAQNRRIEFVVTQSK